MSLQPISLSPDLKRLRDEGFNLQVVGGFLLVNDFPYVNKGRVVGRGTLVTNLTLAGDVTVQPDTHVAYFIGEYPCDHEGRELEKIKNASNRTELSPGVVIDHTFSAKPVPSERYEDYYKKVLAYEAILGGQARILEPGATARTFPPIATDEDDSSSVFNYVDTASSRAEIDQVAAKLAISNVALVGLGGTGSYILDLVAKTQVRHIHLYDQDDFLQHNAFRAPGALSVEQLRTLPKKSGYLSSIYSKMHRGIVDHQSHVTSSNVEELRNMDFVFLSLDDGPAKLIIVGKLEEFGVPFIDVGMGIDLQEGALGGVLRVTTSTVQKRDHVRTRVSFADAEILNEYVANIQIADLNALNAALAVIRWKKLFGFYRDLEHEFNSSYTLDGNFVINSDGDQ